MAKHLYENKGDFVMDKSLLPKKFPKKGVEIPILFKFGKVASGSSHILYDEEYMYHVKTMYFMLPEWCTLISKIEKL